MARWEDVAAAEPGFAARVRQEFEAHRHKRLATLRKDGSPRISGIEMDFADGEVWLGVMPDSVKARDLRRDPRLAVHSASEDPPADHPSAWSSRLCHSPHCGIRRMQRRWRARGGRQAPQRSPLTLLPSSGRDTTLRRSQPTSRSSWRLPGGHGSGGIEGALAWSVWFVADTRGFPWRGVLYVARRPDQENQFMLHLAADYVGEA
jgi:hypothetical protein